MSPYVERAEIPHRCEPPDARSPDPASPVRGDVWDCPDCGRRYYCTGWRMYIPPFRFPSWHRVPRSRWLSARWLRRFWATFVSPPT